MDITPIITGIVAAYGAILSTATLVLTLRSKAWRIVVSYSTGGGPIDGEGWLDFVYITAANMGERPVKIERLYVQTFDRPSLKQRLSRKFLVRWTGFFSEALLMEQRSPLPVELLPGQSLRVTLRQIEIIRELAKFSGETTKFAVQFTDAVGRSYRSRAMRVDVPGETIEGIPLVGVGSRAKVNQHQPTATAEHKL